MQVIQNHKPAVQEVRAQVNDKRLLATMKHLFKSNFSVLSELMQNARRAGASEVSFDFDPKAKSLKVTDNGKGIADFAKLIDLCTSGWDDDVQLADNPFGMGFFSVFFACETVTIRSNGLTLTATHADIIEKRALMVTADDHPVTTGVVLELAGLKDEMLAVAIQYSYMRATEAKDTYVLEERLKAYAMGFPIDVKLNGVSLLRPHAQAALKGVQTPFGFIHQSHVHGDGFADRLSVGHDNTALYLQGLPIETIRAGASLVVHLDGQVFTPQMPDRTQLFEGATQLLAMRGVATQIVRDFLCDRKAGMVPSDFVKTYWNSCAEFGVKHLLNDIPMVPRRLFSTLQQLTYCSEERWAQLYDSDKNDLVTKADIDGGVIRAWRNVPEDIEDSAYWAVLQKMVSTMGIHALQQCESELDPGHWLFKSTPSCSDFIVDVAPVGETGKTAAYSLDGYNCKIQIVDAVEIRITSSVDSAFEICSRIDDSYVVVGTDLVEDENAFDKEVTCYAMAKGSGGDCPVMMFSSFRDENEQWDEDDQNQQVTWWNSLVNSLLGLPLAVNLKLAIVDHAIDIDESQLGQMAVVHASKPWNQHCNDFGYQRLSVVDLEDGAVWERLAALLTEGADKSAESLKAAFKAAIGGTGLVGKPEAI